MPSNKSQRRYLARLRRLSKIFRRAKKRSYTTQRGGGCSSCSASAAMTGMLPINKLTGGGVVGGVGSNGHMLSYSPYSSCGGGIGGGYSRRYGPRYSRYARRRGNTRRRMRGGGIFDFLGGSISTNPIGAVLSTASTPAMQSMLSGEIPRDSLPFRQPVSGGFTSSNMQKA
jgi:hypothetical protein